MKPDISEFSYGCALTDELILRRFADVGVDPIHVESGRSFSASDEAHAAAFRQTGNP